MEASLFIFLSAVLSVITKIDGHEHPRRHRHSFRKGQFVDSIDWDGLFHSSHSGNKVEKNPDLDDLDKWTHSRFKTENLRHGEGSVESSTMNQNNYSHKPLNNNINNNHHHHHNLEEATSSLSKHIINKTFEKDFLRQDTHDPNSVMKDFYQKDREYELDDKVSGDEDKSEEKTSDIKDITKYNDNTFLSAPRWTLKYQGIVSEQALNNTKRNVTASVGGNAFLPCKVGHLGDRQISWIRRRDWHVLTSGKILYTHDKRFSVLHEPGSQDWTLHIKWINMKDSGTYECQVSTGTGIISLFVNLKVVIPRAYIPGHGQYHVDKGSSISLKCYIKNSPSPPQYILWHHNGELLNFLRNRPDVVIKDDLSKNKNQFVFSSRNVARNDLVNTAPNSEETSFVSRLSVALAEDRHSGNYTCSAPNTEAASTLVFITEGDKTAAVQRIDSGGSSGFEVDRTPQCLILFFLKLFQFFT